MDKVLYYVHDPMCSWCWAFNKTWANIQSQLPNNVEVRYVLGGLAADSDKPMPADLQQRISSGWYRIQEKVPGTEFNHRFWTECQPRRSTYPSSRAIIAAKMLDDTSEKRMLLAIQQAYYLQAKNPADDNVLIDCAASIGLDSVAFSELLNNTATHQQLLAEIKFARSIGANSFPSLMLEQAGEYQALNYDYNNPQVLLSQLS
ncbi:MAG: DsbA family protein [Piscirickettsiaceae bacterium]|nr:MAG: DsbA family protein [Piscirickettsiaceae bacterium]PCI65990.1 MAG: DsbA family protein [Piscirickettsiaceae bacterium]